jgi:hypothetical protein
LSVCLLCAVRCARANTNRCGAGCNVEASCDVI